MSHRDKLILRDLFYSKGLNLEILLNRYFRGKHKTTVIKRMNRLYDGKYINKGSFTERSTSQIIYTISPKGLTAILDCLSGQLIRKELKSPNIEHDIELAGIFDQLSLARSLVEIKTENELQSIVFGDNDSNYEVLRRLNTDIYFSLLVEEREYTIAVEFERSQKKSDRWAKYLLNYHLEESIDAVLYICSDNYIKNGLVKIEENLAKKFSGKVFFCTLEEFKSNKTMAILSNTNGKLFTLNFHSDNYHHFFSPQAVKEL